MDINLYGIIILSIIGILLIIQLYYYFKYFSQLAFYKASAQTNTKNLPISVIIAARNEAANLQKYLPEILAQDYPDFEVIVVNDCSYDESEELLKEFLKNHSNLKVVDLKEDDKYKHGKKFAITLGIKAAKNEHLLFTDADCKPSSKHWIQHMQSHFHNGVEIVIGHSPFIKESTFLNYFSRFETFFTAFQYISFSLKKRTYMGVGRNMAYTKTLFFKNKGFASHMHVLSGDDDLFVNQAATHSNTAVCLHPDSYVYTDAKPTWTEYFQQKLRHYSAGKLYKTKDKLDLTLITLSNTFFYLAVILAFLLVVDYRIVLGVLGFKYLLTGIYYYRSMHRLEVKDLFWIFPILDILYFIVIPCWTLMALFTKQKKWK